MQRFNLASLTRLLAPCSPLWGPVSIHVLCLLVLLSGKKTEEMNESNSVMNKDVRQEHRTEGYKVMSLLALCFYIFFFNLHSGGWNQGPLDTAVT
jgi:hypothetical protein